MNTYKLKVRSEPNGSFKGKDTSFIRYGVDYDDGCTVYTSQVNDGCILVKEISGVDVNGDIWLETADSINCSIMVNYDWYLDNRELV